MAKKKIYELDPHSSIVDSDVTPISATASGNAEKSTALELKTYIKTGLTTADVTTSTDKNYVTDAQLTVIGNTSWTNSGNQVWDWVTITWAWTVWDPFVAVWGWTGDVIAPATNTDSYIPQWNWANSKTLKNWLAVVTTLGTPWANTNIPTEAAVRAAIVWAWGGDVSWPASAVDNNIAVFDWITGKIIKDWWATVASKVTANTAITGATKTKITYDTKGLVTAWSDATTADIADSSNKRYVTDAQLTVIWNTSWTNTGDQTLPTRDSLGLDTDDSPQFAGIELWNASDTTITRTSSWQIAVEWVQIPSTSSTHTLTNKRVAPKVTTITSHATPTLNYDLYNCISITAQAEAITSMTTNLSWTPTDFEKLLVRIKDNGTARAITWWASFEAKGVALPTTTVVSKVLTVWFIYDSVTSKWWCVAVANEA